MELHVSSQAGAADSPTWERFVTAMDILRAYRVCTTANYN